MITVDSLIAELDANPDDVSLRERAARALERDGRPAEAVKLLQDAFIQLNAHEPALLPCLCRRCMAPAETTVTISGTTYHRDFVVAGAEPQPRVLFFWIPEMLMAERRRVRRSVHTGLRSRLG